MSKNTSGLSATADPVPLLVEGRFRLLDECQAARDQIDAPAFERRMDEAYRRARRLDERIVGTVATSTAGLLAQLRLLALFYDESMNGAGRRGSLLIKTIAAGIERLDTASLISSSAADAAAADRYQDHREDEILLTLGGCDPRFGSRGSPRGRPNEPAQ